MNLECTQELLKLLFILLILSELFPFLKYINKMFRGIDGWLFLCLYILHLIHKLLDGSLFKTMQDNVVYKQEKKLKELVEKILADKTISDETMSELNNIKKLQMQLQELDGL